MTALRLQEIIVSSRERSKEISKLKKQGLIRKIAPRLYTSSLEEPAEKIIRLSSFTLIEKTAKTSASRT